MMRRTRSQTGYGNLDNRPHAPQGVGPAAPLPFIPWLVPAVLAALVVIATLHAAHVVGAPLVDRLRAPAAPIQPSDLDADPRSSADLAGFSPTVRRWQRKIDQWSARAGLSTTLVATVMQIESCGDPQAISPSGALGLFQVMPYHFEAGQDPLDPDTNAEVGLRYLARALDLADGDVTLALAGYNGGHGVVQLAAAQWPAETKRYVTWGTAIIDESRGPSQPTLARWLAAGGASLCRQAAATPILPMAAIVAP